MSSVRIPSDVFNIDQNLNVYDTNNSFEVKNMPKIQSQDTVGSCFGCSSATIAQKYICDTDSNIIKSKTPCNDVPKDMQISQLSLVAWADTNAGYPNKSQIPGQNNNHTNLRLYAEQSKELLVATTALANSASSFEFMPESCYPMDILVNKYGNQKPIFEEIYNRTKKLYESNKRKETEAKSNCTDCLDQLNDFFIKENFKSKITTDTFNLALTRGTFGEFLYTLLFDNCDSILVKKTPTFKKLPLEDKKAGDSLITKTPLTLSKKSAIPEMIKILNSNKPFLVNTLCLMTDQSKSKCTSQHSVVVNGYRKACPTSNLEDKSCKYQFKLHNCWGQDWQGQNNDGWVDAEKFRDNLNFGSDFIENGDISWLE
jgi:hypothetical protein